MNHIEDDIPDTINQIQPDNHQSVQEDIAALFARLNPQDVEQFYQSYQRWSIQPRMQALHTEIAQLQQAIAHNVELMNQYHPPSPMAQSILAEFRAHGVTNIDLLDTMLERGDSWLDHTIQLLEQCEHLDIIHDNYTEWCEHALEGAYDWIASMEEDDTSTEPSVAAIASSEVFDESTEKLLLQKLLSEEEEESDTKTNATDTVEKTAEVLTKTATKYKKQEIHSEDAIEAKPEIVVIDEGESPIEPSFEAEAISELTTTQAALTSHEETGATSITESAEAVQNDAEFEAPATIEAQDDPIHIEEISFARDQSISNEDTIAIPKISFPLIRATPLPSPMVASTETHPTISAIAADKMPAPMESDTSNSEGNTNSNISSAMSPASQPQVSSAEQAETPFILTNPSETYADTNQQSAISHISTPIWRDWSDYPLNLGTGYTGQLLPQTPLPPQTHPGFFSRLWLSFLTWLRG